MSQSIVSSQFLAPRAKAMLLVLLSVVLWGFVPIGNRYFLGAGHLALPGAPYMALRYSIASVFFLPALAGAVRSWSWRDWGRGAICGLTGVGTYNLLAGVAGRSVSAGLTGIINSSESLMILLLACLIARRAPDRRTIFAAVLGVMGIVLLASSAGPAVGNVRGILLLLGAAIGWAIYCVVIPPLIKKHGAVQSSAVTMVIGTLPLLAAGGRGIAPMVASMSLQEWEILVSIAIGTSVVALVAWNKGVAVIGAQTAGWFLYLIPVCSALGGFVLLGEPLTLAELAGGAMILGSVYIAQRRG